MPTDHTPRHTDRDWQGLGRWASRTVDEALLHQEDYPEAADLLQALEAPLFAVVAYCKRALVPLEQRVQAIAEDLRQHIEEDTGRG